VNRRSRRVGSLAAALASLIVGALPAFGEAETTDETPPKTERPETLDRPIGLKPYFLSPPPERPALSDEQRAVDYRSNLEGEIKRLERRPGYRGNRRGFDHMQSIRRKRAPMGRVPRR
jgi:hypothetical protein